MPGLQPGVLNPSQGQAWIAHIESGQALALNQTVPHLVLLFPETRDRAIAIMRRGLASRDDTAATFPIWAVLWFPQTGSPGPAVPDIFERHRHPMCLPPGHLAYQAPWCARLLLEAGLLNAEDRRQLLGGLGFLLTELRYEDWDETDPRTKSLSLTRA